MTLLLLLLSLAVVAGVAAVAAGLVTGGMDEAASSVPVHRLPPVGPLDPAELAALRFSPALRGYRMDQVDAALDRLVEELYRLRQELAEAGRPQDPAAGPATGEAVDAVQPTGFTGSGQSTESVEF